MAVRYDYLALHILLSIILGQRDGSLECCIMCQNGVKESTRPIYSPFLISLPFHLAAFIFSERSYSLASIVNRMVVPRSRNKVLFTTTGRSACLQNELPGTEVVRLGSLQPSSPEEEVDMEALLAD